jgi:hypothetical protein
VSTAADAASRFQEIRSAYEGLLAGGATPALIRARTLCHLVGATYLSVCISRPAAGGEQQRPWWRARWTEQLRALRARIKEKLTDLRRRRERSAADANAGHETEAERAAADELRRNRVAEQLSGLSQRSQRRGRRRRPPGAAAPPEW